MKRVLMFLIVGSLTLFFRYLWVMAELEGAEGLNLGVVEIEACIVGEVDVRKDKVKYVVEWEGRRILVNSLRYPVYEYGDCLLIAGQLDLPGMVEDFDYSAYLKRFGISYILYADDLRKISDGGWSLYRALYSLKGEFSQRINQLFPEPYGSFMLGLLLGSKKGMSQKVLADFQATGLTHIVAVSGYNVSLIVIAVFWFCGLFALKRRHKVVISIIFVCLFVIFVGASAAVVRAGLMGAIALMTVYYGSLYVTGTALLFSAYLMGMFNPLIVLNDVGFHLSFLATVGIVYIYPWLEKRAGFLPSFLAFKESLLMTLSAQIAVTPVLLLNFGSISLISPVVNVLVLPLLPAAMFFGFLALCISYLAPLLATLLAFIGYLDLRLILWIVELFA